MRKNIAAIIFAVTCLSAFAIGMQRLTETIVTSHIADADATIAPTLRVQSDGQAAYPNSKTLSSLFQGIGDWELDMLLTSNTTRTVKLDLSEAIAGTGPNGGAPIAPFGGAQNVEARFITKCTNVRLQDLLNGQTAVCPLAISFDYGGQRYRFAMNNANFNETNDIRISCTSVNSTNKCNRWKFEPFALQPDGSTKSIGKLLKVSTVKGKTVTQDQGDFYLSFSITATNP
ncbi:MAG TPA: hypothetical protein VFZ34_18640 [Blastocatellia bacterium]|nr:hypothetical protein [Blastocatellia bacterium]